MNNLQINEVLLKRKQQILPSSILKGEFNQDLKIEVAQLNNVLMKLGYRLSYNLTQYLMMTTKEYILEVKVFLLKKIREMVGYAREMKPLFPNFPQVVSSMDIVDIIIFNIIYADLGFDRDAFDKVLNLFGIVEVEIKEEDKKLFKDGYRYYLKYFVNDDERAKSLSVQKMVCSVKQYTDFVEKYFSGIEEEDYSIFSWFHYSSLFVAPWSFIKWRQMSIVIE